MATTNLTDIYPHVMLELPKCPKGFVLQAFRTVLREFLHRTQVYELDMTAINIEDGKTEYAIDSPIEKTEIDAVTEVKLSGSVLTPGDRYTVPVQKDVVILVSEPDADITDGLEIKVALKTTMAVTEIESRIFDDWFDCWAAGVKAKRMLDKRKAWTDRELAVEYNRQYWEGIREATHERLRDHTAKTTILRPKITI